MSQLHGLLPQNTRFAGLRTNCISPAKRYFVASAPNSRDIYVMVLYVMVPNSVIKQET